MDGRFEGLDDPCRKDGGLAVGPTLIGGLVHVEDDRGVAVGGLKLDTGEGVPCDSGGSTASRPLLVVQD